MIRELVKEITGGYELEVGDRVVNFKEPWKRISFVEGLQ